MKKGIIILAISLALFIAFPCCEDFLTKEPQGVAFQDSFLNETGIDVLLIAAYRGLNGLPSGGYAFGAGATNWLFGSVASDDAHPGAYANNAYVDQIGQYNLMTNSRYINNRWQYHYESIERANDVLRAIERTEGVSEGKLTNLKAQAMFLRAYYHFELVRVFKKIPYITEDLEDPTKVSNDIDVYPNIVSDLQYAVANLPPKQAEAGRCTKYAAMAVLARVYLFMHDYAAAKTQLDGIISSEEFQLMDSFHDNFRIATENNKESIFEIQAAANDGTGGTTSLIEMRGCATVAPEVVSGWGYFQPTQNLVNAFRVDANGLPMFDTFNDNNLAHDQGLLSSDTFIPTDELLDPRLDWTVGRRGIPYLDWGIYRGYDWVRVQSNGGPYMTKKFFFYKSEKSSALDLNYPEGANANNFRYYRYAHILLWRAEVAVEENDLEYALQLVNMIRNRAKNSPVVMGKCNTYELKKPQEEIAEFTDFSQPAANYKVEPYSSFPDQNYARNAVRWELRLEFATEGHRFFDLVRWGIAAETLNEFIKKDEQIFNYMKGRAFIAGKHEYCPIPENQLALQPGVLTQNDNW